MCVGLDLTTQLPQGNLHGYAKGLRIPDFYLVAIDLLYTSVGLPV